MNSIVYDLRLPKDPPRTFDLSRVTICDMIAATKQAGMNAAVAPICRIAGLANYELMVTKECSAASWASASERQRMSFLALWLQREAITRG